MKNTILILMMLMSCTPVFSSGVYDVDVITRLGDYTKSFDHQSFIMHSSYDRSGGNDDGFAGTYSIIRKENGNSVISEIEGAGTITRIWFPFNDGYPEAPMSLIGKRIYIYLDGNSEPAINVPVVEMFNNTNPNFPFPLCGMALGGCFSHLPIPFNNGAKVVVEGDKVGFFQIQYTRFDKDRHIDTFEYCNNPIKGAKKVLSCLSNLGDVTQLDIEAPITNVKNYSLKKGINKIALNQGDGLIVRAFIVKGDERSLNAFLQGGMKVFFDGESTPSLDLPISMFFIRENDGLNARSLLAGTLTEGGGVYNFMPMPYKQNATIKFTVAEKCNIEITAIYENAPFEGNYLKSSYNKDCPTTPGKKHVWLDVTGTGHYIGVYMRSKGKSLSCLNNLGTIYWTSCLEGDESFEVDGEEVSHGTGTEDYFNAGWNGMTGRLCKPQCLAFSGYTLFDANKNNSATASYRWHLPTEVIPFKKSLKGKIEVGPTDNEIGDYESVAYYYLSIQK